MLLSTVVKCVASDIHAEIVSYIDFCSQFGKCSGINLLPLQKLSKALAVEVNTRSDSRSKPKEFFGSHGYPTDDNALATPLPSQLVHVFVHEPTIHIIVVTHERMSPVVRDRENVFVLHARLCMVLRCEAQTRPKPGGGSGRLGCRAVLGDHEPPEP